MQTRCRNISERILAWYDSHARRLPWRVLPGQRADPYLVWLSEIMLQQTTVVTVGPYFDAFTRKWPNVQALAAADLDDVLTAWAGLGYYARARNLHKCARAVTRDHGGLFPSNEAALRSLPGIGPYTAAAVAAIAFNLPSCPVDGNIERVVARLFALSDPLPGVKKAIKSNAQALTFAQRPGDQAQAMMDLGATICTPKKPKCPRCPLREDCRAHQAGIAEALPVKPPKPVKPHRRGQVFWLTRPDGAVLLRRRPETGLLGGMMEFPSTPWLEQPQRDAADAPRRSLIEPGGGSGTESAGALAGALAEALRLPQDWLQGDLTALPGAVRHSFTHFHLELQVRQGWVDQAAPAPPHCCWVAFDALAGQALPRVMTKVIQQVASQAR